MKYRIKEYNPINDLWILEKHVFLFFWKYVALGSKKKLEAFLEDQTTKQ